MAAKNNESASDIDKTTYFWVGLCGICHPGGGPSEYDRDGELLYDAEAGKFGYEVLGKTAEDVTLDGDYAFLNPATGDVSPARWDLTGVSEPDCLSCHRSDRTVVDGKNMNWIWRTATLRSRTALVDAAGNTVPAYAAAATAGQGWFSEFALAETPPGKPPMASKLQIDYSTGITNGSLLDDGGKVKVAGDSVVGTPRDQACWGCHGTPDLRKRGRVWFDPENDVHYAKLNHLDDNDPENDITAAASSACTYCHEAGEDHNFGKGNSFLGSVRNDTDYADFRTCRSCHLEDSPDRDPSAPMPRNGIHSEKHLATLACQACHIPFKRNAADLVVDNSVTGSTVLYKTSEFLSADPLDPTAADKSQWSPSFKVKTDEDGVERLYPVKLLLSVWWGDWNQNGTPDDLSDDIVEPIPLWRVRQITKNAPLEGVTDDNGDGKPEVNRLAEIALYITALQGNDSHGAQVAKTPVLVKGGRVWYADPQAPEGVASVSYEEAGITAESSHPFSVDHNVLDDEVALGNECNACHGDGLSFPSNRPSPVFDRLILVDAFGVDSNPVYETVSELTGIGEREDEETSFVRGDGNADGTVNISDPMFLLNSLFSGGPGLPCEAAGDANGDGAVNISDVSSLLNFLFANSAPPVAPFPECGPGELDSDEELGCATPPAGCGHDE